MNQKTYKIQLVQYIYQKGKDEAQAVVRAKRKGKIPSSAQIGVIKQSLRQV